MQLALDQHRASAPRLTEPPGPAALLRDLKQHFPELGITRLASQTGLDRTGIACYAAIRPNSRTLASHQGKGMDALSAQISAVMEAAEYAVAEAPELPTRRLSLAAARTEGRRIYDVASLMPRGWTLDPEQPVRWAEGQAISDAKPVLVPYDAVVLGQPPADLVGLSQSTNGVAAGTSLDAALLHGLCEAIERDAVCLWGFRSDQAAAALAVDPADFDDADIDALRTRIEAVGYRLRLFDITTNLGVPAIYAVLAAGDDPRGHFEVATGASAHPVAAVAARRAIVEAAQTRITMIAGARDDIEAEGYDASLARSLAVLTEAAPANRPPPRGLRAGRGTAAELDFVRDGLARARLDGAVVVPLGGERFGILVAKVLVPGLEDRLTNRNWRPGARATAAMLGFL